MRGYDGQSRVMGSLPVLFAGVGPCAERVLAALSQVAGGLTVPVQGPFGLVLVDVFGDPTLSGDWLWLADFRVPESAPSSERAGPAGPDGSRLPASVSSLVRRLHSVEPAAESAAPGRTRLNSYVVVDLSVPPAVVPALQVMQALRQADPAQDMTVLGVTARTAGTDAALDNQWFESWKQLLAGLQEESCAQRVYLLDGCDADKTWFERPEQLHRLGAEFLLHHGLTCRSLLRQNEQTRTGAHENLLSVCGSFGCRTIPVDLTMAAQRVAERLAREDLSELYQRTVPDGWRESLDEQAQALVDRIAHICEKGPPAPPASAGMRRDPPGGSLVAATELSQAIAQTITRVCSREPLVSLCYFFKSLQPRLGKSLTRQRLWQRSFARRLAIEAFRRQNENTYEPLRRWLSDPTTEWVDRFTPRQGNPPPVAVSRPVGVKNYLVGGFFFLFGLAGVAAGWLWSARPLVLGGGWLSLVSAVLMTLPTGWGLCFRDRIREGQEATKSVAPVLYRRRPGGWTLWMAGPLILVGLAGVAGPLWPAAWTPVTTLWAGGAALAAALGVLFLAGAPTQTHPQQVGAEEAPGHAAPALGYWRVLGLACVALAWTVLWLWAPLPAPAETKLALLLRLGGLSLIALGIAWILFPRVGRAYLVDLVPNMPQPLTGGIGARVEESELSRRVGAIAAWVNRVALDPDQCLRRVQTMEPARERDTLFDFLAPDWDRRLADAVRHELKARANKNLKTLALQPILWTDCITKALQDPQAKCSDLTTLFASQAVKAWIESHTFAELLSFLDVDLARFARLTGRLASPHWPAPRVDPEVNASVIAVGKPLWDVLAPLVQAGGGPPIVPLDWDAQTGVIVVLRVVQGLAQGWRGFPGMPGQVRRRAPAALPDSTATADGMGGAEAPAGA